MTVFEEVFGGHAAQGEEHDYFGDCRSRNVGKNAGLLCGM
jgi:hypothetical protein